MKLVKAIIIILLILAFIGFYQFIDVSILTDQEKVKELLAGYGILAPFIFMLIYIIATIFFIPGTILTILSGFLFGIGGGTLYTVIGASIGAIISFLLARFLGRKTIKNVVDGKLPKLKKYDDKLHEHGFWTTMFFRLAPLFPFNALNYGLGLTKVSARDYSLATIIGIIPGTFVLAGIGANATDITGPKLYIFIGLFIFLGFIPTIYKKIKGKKSEI